MNDNLTPQSSQSAPETEDSRAASLNRRRLLKIGTRVAPIALTLAARPSFACHCVAPSAWGSVVATAAINGETGKLGNDANNIKLLSGSITARHDAVSFNVWQASHWKTGTAPWSALASKLGTTGINRVKNAKVGLVVDKLGLVLPQGIDSNATTFNVVNSNGPSVAMLVAQFNVLLRPGDFPQACGDGNLLAQVKLMVQGSYPTIGSHWTPSEVHTYLDANWIARGF